MSIILGIYGAEEKTVPAVKENTLSGDSKQAIDYDYNDEEDNSSGGGSHSDGKMLHAKSTVMPYFEHNITTVYLKPDQDNLQLKCHPKNFDGKYQQLRFLSSLISSLITDFLCILPNRKTSFNPVVQGWTCDYKWKYYVE